MRTLIRNATVVVPDAVERINVLIEGHRIVSIDAPDSARADDVIDAKGLHLLPGLIDDQVHNTPKIFSEIQCTQRLLSRVEPEALACDFVGQCLYSL